MIAGREFLEVRAFLLQLEGEASARTRTGRDYYAAFHEALALCESRFEYKRRRGLREHADVPQMLAQIDPGASDNLILLRRLRNTADYDLTLASKTVAEQTLLAGVLARSIVARLDELRRQQQEGTTDQ